MTQSGLEQAVRRIATDLVELNVPFALVGGLAVSVRTEPRFTRDADLAVSVASDVEAEQLLFSLTHRAYQIQTSIEHTGTGRLATARLVSPARASLIVDLLFASSGIEREVVAEADYIEIFADLKLRVAKPGHLVAMKLLSSGKKRAQDAVDLASLRSALTDDEIARARRAVALIQQRACARGRDLDKLLQSYLEE